MAGKTRKRFHPLDVSSEKVAGSDVPVAVATPTPTSGQGRSNRKSPVEPQLIASFKFHVVHRERRNVPLQSARSHTAGAPPPPHQNGPLKLRFKTLIHSFLTLLTSARHIGVSFLSYRLFFPGLRRVPDQKDEL